MSPLGLRVACGSLLAVLVPQPAIAQDSLEVIDNFVDEYLAGRTPNPCVVCNRKIKWEELLRKADALGADCIATGHYARIRQDASSGRSILSRGTDPSKDQSYALWGLTQASLSRTLFPLGDLTKTEARRIGERMGLKVAGKAESYEICFIPDNNYTRFLKERIPLLEKAVGGGEMMREGEVVGRHEGYPFYTIGQRRGLGVAMGQPVYVTAIDAATNRVTLGAERDLYAGALVARDVNVIKYPAVPDGLRVQAKIRYKDEGGPATLRNLPDGRLDVRFDSPRRAVTSGQSVVFFEGDDVVGGGIIDSAVT